MFGLRKWLFGISQGLCVGIPNLLGASREKPEQVRESDVSILQTPRDPEIIGVYLRFSHRVAGKKPALQIRAPDY